MKENLKFDINNFLNLLQNNSGSDIRNSTVELDKLSIILSASEPQSSLTDKENSNPSANRSFSSNDADDFFQLIREIKKDGLNNLQQEKINKLQQCFQQQKKNKTIMESKLKLLEKQFEEEKKGTDQILKALVKMDVQEKQLWQKYNSLKDTYNQTVQKMDDLQTANELLRKDLEQMYTDQEFMKKLVLVANQNFEKLEKKCKKFEHQLKKQDEEHERKSSRENLTRSTKRKKNSYSPSISDFSNLSPSKGEFEENYRRMVLRTLKNKGCYR